MKSKGKQGVDGCAEEMAAYTLGLLSALPAEEREARIQALEKAVTSLPSNPPARGTRASTSRDGHAPVCRLAARGRGR